MADLRVSVGSGRYPLSQIMGAPAPDTYSRAIAESLHVLDTLARPQITPLSAVRAETLHVNDPTLIPFIPSPMVATLWVNASTGSDANSIAAVRAGGGSVAWATIGRAVWGSTSRAAPNASQAADEGDIVSIQGSGTYASPTLYTTNEGVNTAQAPVYLPANSGSAGNYITFQANGYVKLGAPAANGPVVGNTGSVDYIKWIADRTNSRFIIVCDGRFSPPVNITSSTASGGVLTVHTSGAHGITNGEMVIVRHHNCTPAIGGPPGLDLISPATVIDSDTFTIANQTYTSGGGPTGTVRQLFDVKADATIVNTSPDTGPVFMTGHCWIEGFDIDGGPFIDYDDNWDGIRVANGQGYTIRNNYIHDFRKDSDENAVEDTSGNQTAITMYGAQNGLIEHNLLENNGAGIYFKDTLSYQATLGNTVRLNWITTPEVYAAVGSGQGVRWSLIQTGLGHDTNFLYQNVITDCLYAFGSVQGWDDDIYNNTVARCAIAVGSPGNHNGVRYWNNIFSVTDWVMLSSGGTQPGHTVCDFEHNCYFGFASGTFMTDANNHSFAQWLAEYSPNQDMDAPASVNSNPLFTNAAADDFTLQAGSPARNLAVNLGVGVHAGAYQTGSEVIGLEP